MAGELPKFVVLESGGYAYFMNTNNVEQESGGSDTLRDAIIRDRGHVRCRNDIGVFDPYVKIEVEPAKVDDKYVHLRFCASNKYWAKEPGGSFINAASDQPEEDVSKQSCTLFEPFCENEKFSFKHVQSGGMVSKDSGSHRPSLRVGKTGCEYFGSVDWETLVKLPKRVAFKGDEGKYVREYWPKKYPFLQVSSEDGNLDITSFEIHPQPDGHIRIKSSYYKKFWTRGGYNWIASYSEDETGQNKDTLFWPVKINDTTVAFRNAGNDCFIKRLTNDQCDNALNAAVSDGIPKEAKFVVEELILRKSIYDIRYRMEDARIFNEAPFVAGTETGRNDSDKEDTMTLTVRFKEETSFTFTNSLSVMVGASAEFSTGIPFIVEGKISVSAEVTNSLEWNRTKTESKEVEASYTVKVPPKSTAVVTYVGTKGTCNVPFSYTERNQSSTDGKVVKAQHVDGIYNGVSCYNYQFEQPVITHL